MMAVSMGKLGKLDAICARLHKTQEDSNSNGWPVSFHISKKDAPDTENNNVPFNIDKVDPVSSLPPSPCEIDAAKSTPAVPPVVIAPSGRRKNRKATVPRNLTQVSNYLERFAEEKDELTEYKINNQDADFPPINSSNENSEDEKLSNDVNCDENTNGESLGDVCESNKTVVGFEHNDNLLSSSVKLSLENDKHEDTEGVLDLSMNKTSLDSVNRIGSKEITDSRVEKSVEKTPHPSIGNILTGKVGEGDGDVALLKSYAERTMNEFLSMYGFHGDTADTLTGKVPIHNFSMGQILQPHEQEPRVTATTTTTLGIPLHSISLNAASLVRPSFPSPNTSFSSGNNIYTPAFAKNGSTVSRFSEESKVAIKNTLGANSVTPSSAVLSSVVSSLSTRAPATSASPSDLLISTVASPSKLVLPDYSKYIKRYNSAQECRGNHCRDMGYREHFHCLDCNFKVFVRKEEMIRHFKWHKKRDDSLQHGFMRYSPMDDCSREFGVCTHNGRQTHYHCLQTGCDKVYISTSDVQMHANYHRKDSAIIQEGFQRFRATEDCGTPSCSFYGQRTTHFHCRRQDCRFTFKNKADMEKHKSYHQKDEILGRDGFKKFMKYEHCPFPACRFSKISNHIHCIRPGCDYVLHSTGQLYSHKRKHERRDFESAYRRFKENQKTRPITAARPTPPLHPAFGSVGQIPVSRTPGFQPVVSMASRMPFLSTNGRAGDKTPPVKHESEFVDIDDLSNLNASRDTSPSRSASPVSLTTSNQSGGRMEAGDAEDEQEETPEKSGLAAYNNDISGDQLNDSLTLPIPKYTDSPKSETPQTSPQIAYTPNQSPPKTPMPQVASGLSTPVISHAPLSTSLVSSTPPRDWPTRLTISMEKKPKDESWKTYIVRYTANDPCNSRCQYLYKDHYHCKVENCTVLFKSKDAVREHARYHELQERITAMAYNTYESFQACPQECEYSLKEKHYHCIWVDCNHVILDSGPIFNRLEHYRIHEYARASAGKTNRLFSTSRMDTTEFGKRRRGRPPKYPKTEIPVVPKVELSEEELSSLSGNVTPGRIVSSFKRFEENQPCPDELCLFYFKPHFHCARPRCHHATDREDVLNLHTKDFHSFVDIMEGFEFFDRNVNCRRPQCHNNKANRHFHCVRPRCDYSFVRHTTMAQHDKKHCPGVGEDAGEKASRAALKKELPNFVPIAPAPEWRAKNIVKAAGTFYPISTVNRGSTPSANQALHVPVVSTVTSPTFNAMSSTLMSHPTTATSLAAAIPLSVLLQQKPGNQVPLPTWSALRSQMHYALQQNCARPFCKLKKKDHYHCLECNQAFSDPARLRSHIGKHGIKLERVDSGMRVHRSLPIAPKLHMSESSEQPEDLSVQASEPENLSVAGSQHDSESHQDSESQSDDTEEPEDLSTSKDGATPSSSLNLNPSAFANIFGEVPPMDSFSGNMEEDSEDAEESSVSRYWQNEENQYGANENGENNGSMALNLSTESESLRHQTGKKRRKLAENDINSAKYQKMSIPSAGHEEDVFVPEGYRRYKFTEDCGYDTCVYRKTLTHYHCLRSDCGYSFSNRTRVVQHTQRHERIDGITGDEFRQYRGNVDCGHEDCEYRNRSSHFHCLLCSYVCMDAAQVLAHRKHHQKMNKILSQGFQKFSGTEDCKILTCTYYYKKQTHYHCTESGCSYVVLSPSQMAAHKMKHVRENV